MKLSSDRDISWLADISEPTRAQPEPWKTKRGRVRSESDTASTSSAA